MSGDHAGARTSHARAVRLLAAVLGSRATAGGPLDALAERFAAMAEVPAGKPEHHAEGDCLTHTEMVVEAARAIARADPVVHFAALVHDWGKLLTAPEDWPRHHHHCSERAVEAMRTGCQPLGLPAEWLRVASLGIRHHIRIHRADEMRPGRLWEVLDDCYRGGVPARADLHGNPEALAAGRARLARVIAVARADAAGRICQIGYGEDGYSRVCAAAQVWEAHPDRQACCMAIARL